MRSRISNCTLRQVCARAALLIGVFFAAVPVSAQQRGLAAKPRVVITADPELDDNNTIIRAILYSSEVTVSPISSGLQPVVIPAKNLVE